MNMSDNELMIENLETTDGQRVTAQFKDGQLQIVEVTPFDKNDGDHLLPQLDDEGENSQDKYLQVLDGDNDGVVRLDLLNLTLVRCHDGQESYQLLANAEPADASDLDAGDESTVTCVLQAGDQTGLVSVAVDDQCDENSYVMVDTESSEPRYVLLKSVEDIKAPESPKQPMSPTDILEKAKALQKAKALLNSESASGTSHGRKRKSDLPPPHELLASPNFKLYLYSCKLCSFRCNAVKDMSAHKAMEHSAGGAGAANKRGGARGPLGAVSLQCAKCPFRGNTHLHLIKHVQEKHSESSDQNSINVVSFTERVQLDTAEVEAADILVCGACGFESGHRPLFRKHIEDEHGATTC